MPLGSHKGANLCLQNAPKCVWRPGSAQTYWGSLCTPDPCRNEDPTSKGERRNIEGEIKGEERERKRWRTREEKAGEWGKGEKGERKGGERGMYST